MTSSPTVVLRFSSNRKSLLHELKTKVLIFFFTFVAKLNSASHQDPSHWQQCQLSSPKDERQLHVDQTLMRRYWRRSKGDSVTYKFQGLYQHADVDLESIAHHPTRVMHGIVCDVIEFKFDCGDSHYCVSFDMVILMTLIKLPAIFS